MSTSVCFSVLHCLSNICLPCAATLPRKNSKNGVGPDQVPLPPQERPPQDLSDSDLDYDDVIGVLDMYNSEKVNGSTPRSKPRSLHPEGFRGNITRNEPSPTCSTPSSEVASPPPTLPKPNLKTLAGKGAVSPNITPAIPIRGSETNYLNLWDSCLAMCHVLSCRLTEVGPTSHHSTHRLYSHLQISPIEPTTTLSL